MAIVGTNAGETLTGTGAADEINALHGVDFVAAGAGADTVDGDDGADGLVGQAGGDSLRGGDGDDLLIGGAVTTGLTIEDAYYDYEFYYYIWNVYPLLFGAPDGAADTLNGGDGDDILVLGLGDSGAGGDGDDWGYAMFAGRATAVSLDLRGDANAAVSAALGSTVSGIEYFSIYGTAHNDVLIASDGGSELSGEGGSDTLTGGAGSDWLTGGGVFNALTGEYTDDGAADTISAGAGSDTAEIGMHDTADGGAGFDQVYVFLNAAASGVTLNLGNNPNAGLSAALGATVSNFEVFSIFGSNHGDTITGVSDAYLSSLTDPNFYAYYETIQGGGGNDVITILASSSSNWYFYYGYVDGGAGDDQLTGGGTRDDLTGGAGMDVISGGAGADSITGGAFEYDPETGASSYIDTAADILNGGDGGDAITAGIGDAVDGGAGSDTLDAHFEAASSGVTVDLRTTPNASLSAAFGATVVNIEDFNLFGSAHGDTFYAHALGATLVGNGGADTLFGGAGSDEISGGYEHNYGVGGWLDDGAADIISAGGGVDYVYVGLGDSADGGAQTDFLTAIFAAAAAGIALDLRTDAHAALSTALGGAITGFESFRIAGSELGDTVFGNSATTSIYGLGGDDALTSMGSFSTLYGDAGADTLTDGAGAATIYTGVDPISNDRDVDTVQAGGGNDTIYAGVLDNVDGGSGVDALTLSLMGALAVGPSGGVSIDMTGDANAGVSAGSGGLIQGIESFTLYGSLFDDIIIGSAALTAIYAGAGDDQLTVLSNSQVEGGDGDDVITILAGAFSNYASGGDGDDAITGTETLGDSLSGDDGDDVLNGLGGHDYLEGGDGDDTLNGGAGDDYLNAGEGDDVLNGGEGSDWASFSGSNYLVPGPFTVNLAVAGPQDTGAGLDTFISIENLEGAAGDDILIGNHEANDINGSDGDDWISGGDTFGPSIAGGQIFRLYRTTLDRAPDVAGYLNWESQLQSGVTIQEMAAIFIDSAEFQVRFGGLSTVDFVTQLYDTALLRAPDQSGLDHWTQQIDSGAISRSDAVLVFSESGEAQVIADFAQQGFVTANMLDVSAGQVFRLYRTTLDRAPDEAGFSYWSSVLAGPTTLEEMAATFIGSGEFQARFGGLSTTDFVTQLYDTALLRAPDQAGLDYWVAQIDAGLVTRDQAVLVFSESGEAIVIAQNDYAAFYRSGAASLGDTLEGGYGDDWVLGGRGADTFIFSGFGVGPTPDSDEVFGLEAIDSLQLYGFGFADEADARAHFVQQGQDVLLTGETGATVLFHATDLATIADVQILLG